MIFRRCERNIKDGLDFVNWVSCRMRKEAVAAKVTQEKSEDDR